MSSGGEFQIYGPPGTGKTTYLTRQIRNAVETRGSRSILVASFTRSAAAELAGRNLPIDEDRVGTLHAHCWRALNRPELAEDDKHIAEWNKYAPQFALSGDSGIDLDAPGEGNLATRGDELMGRLQVLRARLTPRELWPSSVGVFADKWEEWKRENTFVDFTDLIEMGVEYLHDPPGRPEILVADECQDFTKLELDLIRQWGRKTEFVLMAGDDDQCHPAGTKVLTAESGWVEIEDVDPKSHKLVSYDRAASEVRGRRGGYAFKKAVRHFDGKLVTVEAGGRFSKSTPEHRWLARWNEAAKTKSCVYLMRKGTRYRIGWCQLFRADGSFRLGVRARIEEADAAWILCVCNDAAEASVMESVYAAMYGLPTIMFKPTNGTTLYTAENIDRVFTLVDSYGFESMASKAGRLLKDMGLLHRCPIWNPQKAFERRGGTSIIEIEACNLLSSIMDMAVIVDGKRPEWHPVFIGREHYSGPVYSLDVSKYHLYFSDGILTHNCIYQFKGSSPEAFTGHEVPDDHRRVLAQSFRVPKAVHAVAQQWIEKVSKRVVKEYRPRDAEGEFRYLPHGYAEADKVLEDAETYTSQGKSVMLLATCGYMLEPVKAALRQAGLPFHNPYRTKRGDWNPLTPGHGTSSSDRLRAFLRPLDLPGFEHVRDVWNEPFLPAIPLWTPLELSEWAAVIGAKGILKHGVKKRIDSMDLNDDRRLSIEDMMELLEPDAVEPAINVSLEWFKANLIKSKAKPMEFPIAIYERRGLHGLTETPMITIGTIHSVKGGQSDAVYLFPDLSRAGMVEWQGRDDTRDSIRRLIYVGMTRAKESLIVCKQSTSFYVPIKKELAE